MEFKQYSAEVQYGATIGAASLASNAVTTAKITAGAVTGAKLSTGQNYAMVAVPVLTGTGASTNVFGTATAPAAGTITGMFGVNNSTAAGIFGLWGTTAGTIAQVVLPAGTIGFMTGTTVLNATVAAGDTLIVTPVSAGSGTAYITFQTAS